MTKKKINNWYVVALICLCSLYPATSLANKQNDKRPNIILILADDLGFNGLGCYGNSYLQTPNIDKMCSEGMKFTNGYSAAPTCAPSRAAIMSGQYSPRTEVYRVREHHKGLEEFMPVLIPPDALHLKPEKITIAEALKPYGYSTAMFGKWHLGHEPKDHPIHQGFDVAIKSHDAHFNFKTDPKVEYPEDNYVGDFFTTKAIEFMEDCVKDKKPFFLYMPYLLIHRPLEVKQKYLDEFRKQLPVEFPEKYLYLAAMTKSLDENVGRLMISLKKMGIDENTFVIFTSDNGGAPDSYHLNLFNQPLRMFKGETYEGGIRVPYIFRWPGKIAPGTVSDVPIHGIDLYPTCLEAAEADRPKDYPLDGLSIFPCLRSQGEKPLNRDALFWYYPKSAGYNEKTGKWKDTWRNVIISGEYKLIEYVVDNRLELFNIKNDIAEKNNLETQIPEKTKKLKRKLDDWKKSVNAPEPIKNKNRKK